MNSTIKLLPAILTFGLLTTVSYAQTTYNGSGRIDQAGSWDNGIPDTVGNPGTINSADGGNGSMRGGTYFITQNAGDLINTFGGSNLSGGSWTLEDGTITTGNDLSLESSNIFTQNGGTITTNDDILLTTSASYTMSGGSLSPGDDIVANNSIISISGGGMNADALTITANASVTISGGTHTLTGNLGNLFGSQVGSMFLNGGSTTAASLGFGGSGTTLTVGGSASGSFAASSFAGNSGNRSINWISGSLMTISLSGVDEWAETEWNAGRMSFDGNNNGVLGDWSTVNDTIFNFDSGTESLSLVAIPEPSTWALAIGALAGLLGFVRRHRK